MRNALQSLLLTAAFVLATVVAGWWGVALLGAAWGALQPGRRFVGIRTASAAGASWALLLVWTGMQGPVAAVADRLGGVMGLPPVVLYVATIAFAALVGGSAAGFWASVIPLRPASSSAG